MQHRSWEGRTFAAIWSGYTCNGSWETWSTTQKYVMPIKKSGGLLSSIFSSKEKKLGWGNYVWGGRDLKRDTVWERKRGKGGQFGGKGAEKGRSQFN